jgi:hypothetical protein
MQWQFIPSGCPKLNPNINTVLHLQNGDSTASIMLTNNAITFAHKTMGTWKLTARDQVKQAAAVLEMKSNKYGRMIILISQITQWITGWPTAQYNFCKWHVYYLPVTYQRND